MPSALVSYTPVCWSMRAVTYAPCNMTRERGYPATRCPLPPVTSGRSLGAAGVPVEVGRACCLLTEPWTGLLHCRPRWLLPLDGLHIESEGFARE